MDLNKTTFIIPIKIENPDRYRNAKIVLEYLDSNYKTNIFIYEISDSESTKLDFITSLKNLNIKHWIAKEDSLFHRTKYLNIMLDSVKTPVVVNYDIDVLLTPKNIMECQDLILKGEADVIYPYENGEFQYKVMKDFNYSGFENSGYAINFLNESNCLFKTSSVCGHCIFFNTIIYKKYGGENEDFVSYGPEDQERCHRFQNLDCKVIWRTGEFVYHFEHYRGEDSSVENPSYNKNCEIFHNIKNKSKEDLKEYYKSPEYSKLYKTICK